MMVGADSVDVMDTLQAVGDDEEDIAFRGDDLALSRDVLVAPLN